VQVAHDAAGRLTGLAPWGAVATSYAYRSTGLLASETRPNGVNTGYSYDTASRLTGVNGIGYLLDANGNRTQMTDGEGVTSYSYDALDRLMQATYPTSTVTYTLDSVGNRLDDGMMSFSYDASDRILNPGFVYDANGNLLADGAASYEYDAANRLVRTTRSGIVTEYGYDGWGNLIQETTNGVTTEFVLDENAAYPRILGEVRSDGGERLYAYGPEGFAVQLAVVGGVEYPLVDGLGSVRQLTDAGGIVILSRGYDAYGNVRFVAGAGNSRLGYTGELQDMMSGLVYLRARHYHPVLGRFLQRDSFGGFVQSPQSLNRYSYAVNNPVRFFDPGGRCAVNSNGSRAASDAECWRLADIIYAMWGDPWFPERFNGIGKDDFMHQVAAAGPSLDAAWMQWQLDQWYSDFAASQGLMDPHRPVMWHEPPLCPPVFCDEHDCITIFLDTVGIFAGGTVVVCSLASAGTCVAVAATVSTATSGFGAAYTAYGAAINYVQGNGTREDIKDVAVSIGTAVAGAATGTHAHGLGNLAAAVAQAAYDARPQRPSPVGGGGSGGFR
jgi:RHS repeat-associated protein